MLKVARSPSRAKFHPSRGELISIGGRNLRLIRAGPSSDRPTIVLEAGAFGCGTDWAVVQDKLAVRFLRVQRIMRHEHEGGLLLGANLQQ